MTLRVVELFSGIGAQRMALMQAGIDHEVVAISEINKHSLASYEAVYGDCPNLGDISKVERLPPCDLVTYSFPCLSGDTLVETSEGWTPIKDVRPGDEVWSRDGWRTVTDHAMTGSKEVWEVKGSQTLPILATGYHPFLARRMSHVWNNGRRSYDRVFAQARWVKVVDGEDVASGPHGLSRGDLIVRVLTPLECWRLMGFPDWAYEKASKVSSETQLYNQAGNSIVVEVLEAIFKTMVEPPKAEQSMLTRWLRWMPSQS